MSNSLKLYTQHACPYCVLMKKKLDSWGYEYEEINLHEQPEAKAFMKERGHRVVPQLYSNGVHLNKCDTADFTEAKLEQALYPNIDGGVEMFG